MTAINKHWIVVALVLAMFATVQGCSDESNNSCPVCPLKDVQTDVVSYNSDTHWAEWGAGDTEFMGHGPKVKFVASYYVAGENNDSLMVCVSMTAIETGGNDTMGWVDAEDCAYVAPTGWRIIAVNSSACSVENTNSDKGWHEVSCGTWVFHYVGDTASGTDICAPPGDCTRFRYTYIATVELQEL